MVKKTIQHLGETEHNKYIPLSLMDWMKTKWIQISIREVEVFQLVQQ